MAKAVRGALELDRHERDARPVEAAAVVHDPVGQRLADEQRQELVDDHPLVVPACQPLRPLEHFIVVGAAVARLHIVDRGVVEQQERGVQPGEHQVLVVARVADDRHAFGIARQILEWPDAADLELDPGALEAVQMGRPPRPAEVDRVEVERRRTGVRRVLGIGLLAQRRGLVEGHVVIHELAHERGARGVRGVVRVVHVQLRIEDQIDRVLRLVCRAGARRQLVVGVYGAAPRADRAQCVVEAPGRPVAEERIEPREHAAEYFRPQNEALRERIARPEEARGAQRAHSFDKPAPVDTSEMTLLGLLLCLACHVAFPFSGSFVVSCRACPVAARASRHWKRISSPARHRFGIGRNRQRRYSKPFLGLS